jgi:hypothetical protein
LHSPDFVGYERNTRGASSADHGAVPPFARAFGGDVDSRTLRVALRRPVVRRQPELGAIAARPASGADPDG